MAEIITTPFEQAFENSMGHEGGYTETGPTYRGIDKRFHPSWPGWTLVQQWLDGSMIKQELLAQTDQMVQQFYKVEFWDKLRGDEVAQLNLGLAKTMFDFAIHSGTHDAVRALQRALNKINRNGQTYPDLVVDGRLGNQTMNTLRRVLQLNIGGSVKNARIILLTHYFGERYNHLAGCRDMELWPGWFLRLAKEVLASAA